MFDLEKGIFPRNQVWNRQLQLVNFQIIGFKPMSGSSMALNAPFSPTDFQAELKKQVGGAPVSLNVMILLVYLIRSEE